MQNNGCRLFTGRHFCFTMVTMNKKSIFFYLFIFLLFPLFSQENEEANIQNRLLTVEDQMDDFMMNPNHFSPKEAEQLHYRVKEYCDVLNEGKNPLSYEVQKKIRTQKDLNGGMMVLAGSLLVVGGGLSFLASDYFYNQYNNAESTQDAIKYRRLTTSFDVLKWIMIIGGVTTATTSAYFFTGEPDRESLAINYHMRKRGGGHFLVH